MCLNTKKALNHDCLLGFKIMHKTSKGTYKPIFFCAEHDDREFEKGKEYECVKMGESSSREFDGYKLDFKGYWGFHALSCLKDCKTLLVDILHEIKQPHNMRFWDIVPREGCEYVIVCVEIKENIFIEAQSMYSMMRSQFVGDKMTILFEVEKEKIDA